MTTHIYFACATKHGQLPPEVVRLYDFIARIVREGGREIYMPHENRFEDMPAENLHAFCHRKVVEADIVVAYLGEFGSLGAGVEVAWAKQAGVPLIGLIEKVKRKRPLERDMLLVLGSLNFPISFSTFSDLKAQLIATIGKVEKEVLHS